ncbi:MATE family efflux transporter, partial [Candidatus Peregrinibacteria bacterium]|mgnify:FL=1|jgi:putative MATE family efflux protein|nr:MATE family efflux transporter [Candidatus Peregrinibacteria bacterium]MBT7484539.1 MATE family efflux transporter [Candidatus Peregrinibacteria bacterium]MBT7703548.1 MATE family efflux transporter [Candidatus Peregrinibacteria bacterium]
MNKNQRQLAEEKIPKLLFKQSFPAIIGLLVMSLYNVVDTIFIGQSVGTLGIAALTIAAPIQMLIIAIAQTIGIGASSIISRALGSKNIEEAESTLGNFFTLILVFGLITTILGLLFLTPLELIFGATETILPYANEYLSIILYGAVFLCFTAAANNIIRAEGNAKFAMGIMIVSTVINLILDPILIFGFDMGLQGAAIATVTAQIITSLLALQYFLGGKHSITIRLKNLKLRLSTTRKILAIGASSLTRQSAGSVSQAIMNHSLGFYGGDLAIAAFGIIAKVFMVVMMPMFGFVQGMQPVLGFNYGAKKFKRAKEALKYSMNAATVFSIMAFVIIMLFTRQIISVFTSDAELINMSVSAAKIVFILTPFIGFQVILSGLYQALGKAVKAIFLSILRQLILLVPFVLLLPLFYGLEGVFYSFPAADLFAGIITGWMLYREFKIFDRKALASTDTT